MAFGTRRKLGAGVDVATNADTRHARRAYVGVLVAYDSL
jgi:hypothetical protein